MWNNIFNASVHRITAVLAAFLVLATITVATAPPASAAPGDRCYVFADGGDRLYRWDFDTSTQTLIGPAGRANIEAIAYAPVTGTLYAADTGQLGILNQSTGAFTPIGPNYSLDLDGMAIHPFTGDMYVSIRNNGGGATDELAVIDLTTFAMTRIGPISGTLDDIDDLAFDPATGRLYAGTSGNGDPTLVRLDESYGYVDLYIGDFGFQDVEGLDWDVFGNVRATTGANGGGDSNKLLSVNKTTGAATLIANLSPGTDFEGIACYNATTPGFNTVTGTVYFDTDLNGSFGGADTGTSGHRVRLYRDVDGNGVLDAADDVNGDGSLTAADARATQVTAADGTYRFTIAATGAYGVVIDTGTLPAGSTLTTPGSRTADFGTGFGLTDNGNDFGYTAPGDLDVTKVSDATGEVNPGDIITYTIDIENTGSYLRSGIAVTDALPAGTSWIATAVEAPVPGGAPTTITDDFSSGGYGGGSGWLGPWTENSDNGSPSGGLIEVANDSGSRALRIGGNTNPPTPNNIVRAFNVAGAQSVTLEFTKRDNSLETGENVTVEIFNGSVWSTLVVYQGSDPDDANPVAQSFDITAYASANTQLRIRPPADTNQGNDWMAFDNFVITAQNRAIVTSPGGAPPNLVTAADGYDLFPGETMTVTVVVQVDDPIAYGVTSIDNTVVVTNQDQLGSNSDSVSDPVNLGTIGDTVFVDDNGNGTADAGEGIPSVTVTLTGSDAAGNPVSLATSTDAAGAYSFGNLPRGDYSITVDEADPDFPADVLQTIGANPQSVALATGEDRTNIDFGYRDLGTIGDAVFVDIDGDGAYDAGEGLAGITVTLTGTDELGGSVNLSTVTDADGLYAFTALLAGDYTVTVDESDVDFPASVVQTVGANPQSFALASGEDRDDVDFGYDSLRASVAGSAYHDVDNDGVRDGGEPGIAGATVTLTGTDRFGAAVSLSTVTNGAGAWSFTAIRPADAAGYTITETQPAGYLDGADTVGSLGGTLGNDAFSGVVVAAADAGTGYDFGEVLAASLTGSVYLDGDNDGARDPGETGVGGVTVTLTGTDDLGNPVNLSTTTAADGTYGFTGLRPGTYAVTETHPAGYLDGTDTAGTAGGSAGNDTITGIVLDSGEAATGYDFGELEATSLSGIVYDDTNNNGTFDGADTGIGGVTVTLTGTNDLGSPVNLTTTSAADGTWSFTGLRPGTYDITEAQAAGYLDGIDAAGTLGGTTGNDTVTAIVVGPGQAGTGYQFGELTPATLSGTVYQDNDASGTLTAGDLGIQGVTVTLSGTDDLGNTVIATTTTDLAGTYNFTNLRPGDYTVTESHPAAYVDGADSAGSLGGVVGNDVVSAIPVTPGATGTGYDFGEILPASISGRVFVDADNDGAVDGGESGIAGATVDLTGTDDLGNPVTLTTTTDGNGDWWFVGLRPGTYTATETQPAGYLDGTDAVGTSGGTLGNDAVTAIVLGSGTAATDYTFGELTPASLAGSVYVDGDNDGVRDGGESGIAGATVDLTGTDDLGNPVSSTTTAAADGTYNFTNLRPGDYTITETQPAGYLDGGDAVGTLGGTLGNDTVTDITVTAGANGTGYDFGELATTSLAGSVYHDVDNDGVRDGGEPGIAGVAVDLTGTDDLGASVALATTTNAAGDYSFTNLRPGTYSVVESQPAGYLDGTDVAGSLGGTLGNDTVTDITVDSGDAGTGYDFGELVAAGLAGSVFVDGDNDGVFDVTDTGIAGVTVTLTGTDDLGTPVNVATTTTADGTYDFTNLRPGTYTVTETHPAGYLDGIDTAGTLGGVAGNDVISTITVTSADSGTGYDFAELDAASLSGVVFADTDNNGIQDPGDTGIAAVTVTLTGTDDLGTPVNVATTTAADGTYDFTNLRPGTYTVTETHPAGYLDGIDTAGTAGGTTANDVITNITLTPGQTATAYTFAELTPATLSGTVFEDTNNNGVIDGTETGIQGVTVTLTGTDDLGTPVNVATTTDLAGGYDFTNLRPGTYTVTETHPTGYLDGIDTAGTAGGTTANDTITNITLTPGQTATAYTFGELPPASLSGAVYNDTDNDGVFGGGEFGIPGVTVTLTGTDDLGNPVTLTTTTDLAGGYVFAGLRPADASGYTITETQPTGLTDGIDSVGSLGGTLGNDVVSAIPLTAGDTGSGYDFGELGAASVAGTVYDDLDADGARDAGEPGIAGVTVGLTGTDDLGNPVSLTTTTAADGTWSFDGLRPGDYTVTETQPGGFVDGAEQAGPLGGDTSVNDRISGIVVGSGDVADGNTFGEHQPVTIAGSVYHDANNDGVRDAGEPGIAATEVVLFGTDDQGTITIIATTTDGNGDYTFTDLRPSDGAGYTVIETQPSGWLDGIDTAGTSGGDAASVNDEISGIVVGFGDTSSANDFGELVAAGLAGSVFVDGDNDGVFDVTDTGIAGVTVTLTGTDDLGTPVNVATTTAADGTYDFTGLRPGDYTITETHPAGYLDGIDTAGTLGGVAGNDVISTITVTSADSGTGYDFAELDAASLSGVVFADTDNNGIQDPGDTGIAAVTVTLTGTDDLGTPVNVATTTTADGTYDFTNLRPGTYTVTETHPAGYLDGIDTAGTLGGVAGNDVISTITVTSADSGTGYTFAELTPATLSGTVFEDTNNNGVIDGTETGIQGVTVTLTGTDDLGTPVNVATTTDLAGGYDFTNLRPGTYTVTETHPTGYLDGIDTAGTAGGTTANDTITNITLTPGQTATAYTFGELASTSMCGAVFVDGDNDGIADAADTGIPGVTVTLTGTDDLGNPLTLTTTTDLAGGYGFAGLRPGTYAVTETQPAGYLDGIDMAGAAGGVAGNDTVTDIVLGSGQMAGGYTFAELVGSSLSGSVYLDADNDGIRDPAETGVSGTLITLTGTDDLGAAVNRTTTTAADGTWTFTNLRPGDYVITETQPAGLFDGIDTVGTQGGTATANDEITVVLVPATAGVDNTFGELAPAAIGDFVWLDIDDDGVQDPAEGIDGVTVEVYAADGTTLLATTTTAADGSYAFTNLAPHQGYVVAVVAPTGATFTTLPGTDDANDSDVAADGRVTVTPTFGDNFDVADAGIAPAQLSGTVWFDADRDGALDAGEQRLSDVTVDLLDGAGTLVGSTTTAADGTYTFAGLMPGGFEVAVHYSGATYATPGADSDVDSVTGRAVVMLPSGTTLDGGDAGVQPALIGDRLWLDLDVDGTQGAGEPGIAGVAVALEDVAGSVVASTVTDATGAYLFAVLPDDYQVVVTPVAGTAFTTPGIGSEAADSDVDAAGTTGLFSAPSGDRTDIADAGIVPAVVTGTVWLDVNADGLNNDTSPVTGAAVELYDGTGSLVATTSTAPDGSYAFSGLEPGVYTVVVLPPDGAPFTNPGGDSDVDPDTGSAVVVAATAANVDAGVLPGFIGGLVWLDLDGDGSPAGEAGAGGVGVGLVDAGGATIATTTTDGSGAYTFGPLAAGDYTVVIDPSTFPAGTSQTFDPDGTADAATTVTLPLGASLGDVDFGFQPPATITGIVFADRNGNGLQNATDAGLSGVEVAITDTTGATLIITTAADGTYSAAVAPGAVTIDVVEATLPDGAVLTTGNDVQTVSAAAAATMQVDAIGYRVTAEVAGRVWRDTNRNGLEDASEGGLAGIPVRLIAADGTVVAVALTAPDGRYAFADVASGAYTVRVDAAALPGDADNATGDPDGIVDGATSVMVTPAADITGLDFGYGPDAPVIIPPAPAASVAGTVWVDADNNGLNDAGEAGLAGIPIIVTWLGTDGVRGGGDDEIFSVTTAADGTYSLTDLPAGRYEVALGEGIPDGLRLSVCPGTCDPATVELASGEDVGDIDFGLVPVVDLSVTVTGDGTPPIAGSTPTFTVTVANAGPGAEAGPLQVVLTLGDGLELVSAGGNGWSAEVLGEGHIIVTIDAALPIGASLTFPVVTTVVDEKAELTVQATVTGTAIDIDMANNSAVTSLGVLPFTGIALFTLGRLATIFLASGMILLLLGRRRDDNDIAGSDLSFGPLESSVGGRPGGRDTVPGRSSQIIGMRRRVSHWHSGTPPRGP